MLLWLVIVINQHHGLFTVVIGVNDGGEMNHHGRPKLITGEKLPSDKLTLKLKITIFYRQIIMKWWTLHLEVSIPECNINYHVE